MATPQGDAGRFDANSINHAVSVLGSVLANPGSWCNLEFEAIDENEGPPESVLFGFLAARGPANPLATVMVPKPGQPLEVGIQHRAGVKAAAQLTEADITLPEGARVVQDHPRRGLVVKWPETADTAVLINWLFPAMRELSRHPNTNFVLYAVNG